MPINSLKDQLKRDEGRRLQIYQDTVGKWTIGYGRNLSDVGISQEEADFLLENDIKHAEQSLAEIFPWTDALDEVRRAVLVNMTFNLGIGGLATFTNTLKLIQQGYYSEAAQHMLQSKWADQVGARAERLAIQMESGNWQ